MGSVIFAKFEPPCTPCFHGLALARHPHSPCAQIGPRQICIFNSCIDYLLHANPLSHSCTLLYRLLICTQIHSVKVYSLHSRHSRQRRGDHDCFRISQLAGNLTCSCASFRGRVWLARALHTGISGVAWCAVCHGVQIASAAFLKWSYLS